MSRPVFFAAPSALDEASPTALRDTSAMLECSLAAAEIGLWNLDLESDSARRSLRHDQCFGYSTPIPEAGWGVAAFLDHVHPLDRSRVEAQLRAAIATAADWNDEFRVVWPDGSVHWLAASGSRYHPQDDAPARMLGVVRDVTAAKLAGETLAASEQMARGQVVALRQTLDALALDQTPDRLAQHISRTITAQLGAHSNSVWRRNEVSGRIGFEFAFEDGQFVSKTDPRIAGASLWLPMDEDLPWPAPLRAGRHCLVEDIRSIAPFDLRDRLIDMGIVAVLMVPMLLGGRLDGVIAIRYAHKRSLRAEEVEFAKTLANQAVLALQLTRLSAERRDLAVTAERNRMARDIHDTLTVGLMAVIAQLDSAAAALPGIAGDAAIHLARAGELARASLADARRSVLALRPLALQEHSLAQALPEMFERLTDGAGLGVDFTLTGTQRKLPPDWEDRLLRIGQEMLTNALRHAGAHAICAVLAFEDEGLSLSLRDDGCGFDPGQRHIGFGLVGMRERAEQMGGTLDIVSGPGGSTITVTVPLAPL